MQRIASSLSTPADSPPRRTTVSSLVLLVFFAGVLAGCSLFEEDTFKATVSGRVTDEVGAPVTGATILATVSSTDGASMSDREPMTAVPDDEGRYVFAFSLEEGEQAVLSVRAELKGALIGERELTVSEKTRDRADVNFVMTKSSDDSDAPDGPSTESGTVSRIVLAKQSGTVIRVRESGGPESVSVTFAAIDSIGRRLASDRAVEMRFLFGQHPGAGLAVNPTSIETNAFGEATAVVTSGTRSGVIQLIAEATAIDGRTVRSDPVRLTIHGGMPDQTHFTLGPTLRNIPGLVRANETTDIEVIVGDKYSNPVIPGTAVYFETTHGVIGGSTETDADGLGSVVLRSGNPLPTQNGFVVVTGETADETADRVVGQTPVLFSGATQITLRPEPSGSEPPGFGDYGLTVADPLGNPLAKGTSIRVAVEGTGTLVSGYTETTLDDTNLGVRDENGDGRIQNSEVEVARNQAGTFEGITEFPFTVSEDPESTGTPEVTAITVSVTSPNGNLDVTLLNSKSKSLGEDRVLVGPEASVRRLASGAVQVTLREQR